jgi:acetyltransferase-like isoleucine patch superfamily enzyme
LAKQAIQRITKWIFYKFFSPEKRSWEKYQKFIDVEPSVIIGSGAEVVISNPPLDNRCLIKIEEDSQIFGQISVLRPEAKVSIGQRCQINGCSLVSAIGIKIGNDVMIAGGSVLWDNDSHSIVWEERMNDVIQCGIDYRQTPEDWTRHKDWTNVKMHPIEIHDKVWIGMNAMILKGVTIGEGAVVGARSVVTHDVPPYTLVAGNPARIIRTISNSNSKDECQETAP